MGDCMAAIDDVFEVQVATYGSGWKGISVGLARSYRPASLADKAGVQCLTLEAITAEEFESDVDGLIAQLQALKAAGRRKLAALADAERK